MERSRPPRLAAAFALTIALFGASLTPAAAFTLDEQPDAAQIVSRLEAASLRGRVGERGHERIVLSPGTYWVPLPERAVCLRTWGLVAPRRVLANEQSERGWCLAHSCGTAIP